MLNVVVFFLSPPSSFYLLILTRLLLYRQREKYRQPKVRREFSFVHSDGRYNSLFENDLELKYRYVSYPPKQYVPMTSYQLILMTPVME